MTDTIDRLIFALDGDLTSLDKVYAEAEAKSKKTGKTVSSNFTKGFDDTAAAAKKSGVEIEKAIDTSAVSAKASAAMDVLRAKYDTSFAAAQKFSKAQQEIKVLTDAGILSQRAAAAALADASKAADDFAVHGTRAGSKVREGMVLVHEFMRGDLKRGIGSATIELQNFGVLGTAGIVAAVLALPAALAIAAYESSKALERVDEALRRTGDQAGITRDRILSIAQGGVQGQSQTDTLKTLSILSSRANIDPRLLQAANRAVPGYARATETTQDKAAAELEKLLSEPAKGAEELNKEFKLLDVTTTREIQRLEQSGRVWDAQALLVKALGGRFDALAKSSWSLAAGFDSLWNGVKNVWFHTGTLFTGADQTKQQQLAVLKGFNDTTLKTLAGLGYADPHAALARNPGIGINQGGAVEPLRNIMARFDENAQKIATLQKGIAKDNADASAGHKKLTDNQAVGFGLKIAEAYDEQESKAKKLREQLTGLNVAIDHATGKNAQYREQLVRERDAVQTALTNQRTPAQLAAQAADDQRRVAAAPESQRNTLRAQISAQRERERNLANPTTAPYAESIYQSQMGVASLNNRDINKDATERTHQDERLKKSQAEGEAQMTLARAYDGGAKSVAALRAQQEALVAIEGKEIRASQASAYAASLQAKAFGQAAVATAERINLDKEANDGLRKVAAAGGDPVAIAKAKVDAEAMAATAKERENAVTREQIDLANRHLAQIRSELSLREELNRQSATESEIFSRRRDLGNVRAQTGALASGATPDDMRHLEVQQRVIDDLIRRGYDPATKEYQKQLKILLPLNEALSDAADHLNKMRQEASELASGITGPLKNFLRNGGNPLDTLTEVGQNSLDTLVQHELIDPLQQSLEGLFGGMLGTPKDLLGTTPATAMWVQSVSAGIPGIDGAGGGGGILGSLFGADNGGMFGATGLMGAGDAARMAAAGSPMEGGGILQLLTTFAGMFDEGGTIGPGQWGIKSGMPEIIQGGTHGVSILPLTAPVVKAASGAMGRGPGVNSNPGGVGNGGPGSMRQGDTHFWNITTPNVDSFIKSRSQVEARFTQAAARGQRNS